MSLANFLKLVWNEQVKLFNRKSSWVMIGFILVLVIINGVMTQFFGTDEQETVYSDNWREELVAENEKILAESNEEDMGFYLGQEQLAKNTFYLEEDQKPIAYDALTFTYESYMLLLLITIFTIIVASSIVANEFKWGTIKLLLIRPIERSKILFAKYVSVFLFAGILMIVLLVFSFLVGAVLFGVNGLSGDILLTKPMGGYEIANAWAATFQEYGLNLVALVVMATLAFMISVLFRSSAMAIGLSIFLLMAGNGLVLFLSKYTWAKFILFANLNLGQYFNGGTPLIEGMTLAFSITVLVAYFVVFIVASFWSFTKRDIA